MAQNFLLILSGLSGSGKTTIGYAVTDALQEGRDEKIEVVESDPIRKEIMGVEPTERLGADGYTLEISMQVREVMETRTQEALARGDSVIFTSTLTTEEHRARTVDLASDTDTNVLGLWLHVAEDILKERVIQRTAENTDVSDATVDVLEQQIQRQEEVSDWPHLPAHGTIPDITKDVLAVMLDEGLLHPAEKQENRVQNRTPHRKM